MWRLLLSARTSPGPIRCRPPPLPRPHRISALQTLSSHGYVSYRTPTPAPQPHHDSRIATAPPASNEIITLNDPHPPAQNAIDAFAAVLPTIKAEIVKSRHHWDKHEPKMWARAAGLSDAELVDFSLERDLVEVRSAPTSYGSIILGKIRIPAVNDSEGAGYVHVRCVVHVLEGGEDG